MAKACRIPAESIKDILGPSFITLARSLADENQQMFEKYNVYLSGCYKFPDVDNLVPPISLNSSDTIGSMRKCGVNPELQSKALHVENDGLPIPNIAYYIYFRGLKDEYDINFLQYTSILSTHKFIKPRHIFWVSNLLPRGKLWDQLLSEVLNIYYLFWPPPWKVFNTVIRIRMVQTDIVRMQLLNAHGGIYLDDDMFVINSFNPIRKYPFVMSNELANSVINCVLLSEPNAGFLKVWGEGYKKVYNDDWRRNSMHNPKIMSKLYPHLIHVENDTLAYPSWPHVAKLYTDTFDWRRIYSLHVQGKGKGQYYQNMFPNSMEAIQISNTTIAAIMRYIHNS